MYCDAYSRKQQANAELQDALNHLLGQYIGLAIRSPKKYPEKPFLSKSAGNTMSPITDESLLRVATKLGAKINGNNGR